MSDCQSENSASWGAPQPAASTQASEPSAEPVAFVHWPISGAPRLVWYSNAVLEDAIRKSYEGFQPDLLLYPAAPARAVEPLTPDEIEEAEFNSVDQKYGHLDVRALSIALIDAFCRKNGIGIPATTPTQAAQAQKMEIASRQDACEHWNLLSDGTISQCTKCGARFPTAAQGASNE